MRAKRRLVWTLNLRVIAIAVLAILVIGGVSLYREHAILQETLERDLAEFETMRRQTIRDRTLAAKKYIDFLREHIADRLGGDIRDRVDQAHLIATNIVERFAPSHTKSELLDLVREALRPIRWRGGRGYFFILDADGVNRLHPPNPPLENVDLVHHADPFIRRYSDDVLRTAQTADEGFLRIQWPNPAAEGKTQEKLVFVKHFAPLDIVIGTGEYLADFEAEMQTEALNSIETMRFGPDEYIFAGTWDGIGLVSFLKGENLWDSHDVNGVYMIREMIAKAKAGGGFVEYFLPEDGPMKPFRKISYAVSIPEWQWFVGTGTSLQDIEAEIAARRDAGLAKIRRSSALIAVVIATMIGLFILLANRTLAMVKADYRLFSDFLNRAATDRSPIRTDDIAFAEFAGLADAANHMIAERADADRALHESEARFRTIMDNMPAHIVVKDQDNRYVLCNRAFIQAYGGPTKPDGTAMTTHDVLPPPLTEEILRLDQRVRERGETLSMEARIPRGDGSEFDALIIKFPLPDNDTTRGLVGSITMDVSELKAAESSSRRLRDEVAHVSRLVTMGEMAASVSHELNQPLLAISNFAAGCRRRLESAGSDPLNLLGALQRISDEAVRAGEVIRTVRDMAHKRELKKQPVDIARIVRDIVVITKSDSSQQQIDVDIDVAPDLPTIIGDPVGLRQVLINLVRNGMEACSGAATPERKQVAISAFLQHRAVVMQVRDTGTGMTEELRRKVFEPFFTTKAAGTGLGLAICRRIIEAHGGTIGVESTPGAGTTFTVSLPVGPEGAQPEPTA